MSAADRRALRDRVAIVTGGSSGIGRAAAIALARAGARLAVVGRDDGRLRDTLAAAGAAGSGLALRLDVRRADDMDRLRDLTLAAFGRIDILVASAGIGQVVGRAVPAGVARLPVEEWDAVVGTNLTGVFLSNRAVLPPMIAQGSGEIVNIGSARGAVLGQAYAAPYCASKRAMLAFSEALAEEVAPHGIRVQVLHPELVESPLLRHSVYGTGRHETLVAERVGDLVVDLLTLGDEASLTGPLLAPFVPAPAGGGPDGARAASRPDAARPDAGEGRR